MTRWNCIINVKTGVGPIVLGSPISQVAELLQLELVSEETYRGGGASYTSDEHDVDVYADENGNVEDIHCQGTAILFGQNLIGMTVDDALALVGTPPDEWETGVEVLDGLEQDIAYIRALGITLWIHDGIVVMVVVDDGDFGQ